MSTQLRFAGVVVAIVIAIGGLYVLANSQTQNSGGTRYPNGISADNTIPVPGEVRGTDLTITDDATISGGQVTITTANTATSSLTVGCIQTYATSTATPVRLSATTTAAGGTIPLFVFGSCPF